MFTLLGSVLDFSSFEVFILYLKCSIFQALGCQRPGLTGCFCCTVTVSKICKGWDRRKPTTEDFNSCFGSRILHGCHDFTKE